MSKPLKLTLEEALKLIAEKPITVNTIYGSWSEPWSFHYDPKNKMWCASTERGDFHGHREWPEVTSLLLQRRVERVEAPTPSERLSNAAPRLAKSLAALVKRWRDLAVLEGEAEEIEEALEALAEAGL